MKSNARVIPAFVFAALAAVAPAQEGAWTSHGPTGVGVVNDLAIADAVAYAATPNGVFRSTDGAASWQQSGLVGEFTAQVLAFPAGAFALTVGDFGGPTANVLHVSRDGGATWARVPGLPSIVAAAVDPWQLSTMYAAGADGTIWRSTDDGANWQQISTSPTGSWAMAFAFDSRAIYMTSFDDRYSDYKAFKSSDGGASWTVVPTELRFFVGGSAPGVVYAGGVQSFCRSADSAETWTCSSIPEYPYLILELPGGSPGVAPRILAASQSAVYLSSDGGATWRTRAGEPESVGSFYALASDASGSLVLTGISAGILRSEDRGDSWTSAGSGLRSAYIQTLAADPRVPSVVWAGAWESGLFRSADGGSSWSAAGGLADGPLETTALAVDPERSSTLYAGSQSGVSRSDDGGAHWTTSDLPGLNALAIDPASADRVWAATHQGLFRSDDGARTWNPTSIAQRVFTLLVDDTRPGTLYVGSDYDLDYDWGHVGGSLFVSRDSGATFTKVVVDRNVIGGVSSIAADAADADVLYAGTLRGVFRSTDAGRTWEAPAQNIGRAYSLVADPVRSGRLYASTEAGVYRTVDGARTWQAFSSGLGSLPVGPLVVSKDGRWLHVGTNGGGVFELDLEPEAPIPCEAAETPGCRRLPPRPVDRLRPIRTPRGSWRTEIMKPAVRADGEEKGSTP